MIDTGRLEAFSDGVLAVIITIMVLEMEPPHGMTLAALSPLLPVFLSYILSFIYIGIYWNNHHHLFRITEHISGGILWANLHLLFWLSLVPFVTAWMGENNFAPLPTALYGGVLLMAALSWWIMQRIIVAQQGHNDLLAEAMGGSFKEKFSPALYVAGILLSFVQPWMAGVCYTVVALLWIIPDRRVERALLKHESQHEDPT